MSKALTDISNGLASVVSTSAPAIVRVEARRHTPASGLFWSADGLIVTANHVIRRDDKITVTDNDGQTHTASLVGRDSTTDVALLKIEAADAITLQHASEEQMAVGRFVLALARPGRTVQATFGVVSALGQSWRTPFGGQVDRYLQTDVIMYPGFSGGPLVGADGHVLGMNTSGLGQGVSLAIPSTTIVRIVDALRSHGRIRRGYLGVSTQRVRLPESVANDLEQKSGLLIVSVESGSPAEEGGLTLGDTIVTVSGKTIASHEDLLGALSGEVVGQKESVRILRGGQLQELTVKIGERA